MRVNRTIHNPPNVLDPSHSAPLYGAEGDAPYYLAADEQFLQGWAKVFALGCGAKIASGASLRAVVAWRMTQEFAESLEDYLKTAQMREVAEKVVHFFHSTPIKDSKVEISTPAPWPGYIGKVKVEFWPPIMVGEEFGKKYAMPEDPIMSDIVGLRSAK
jgi:hypothetical protein